MKALHLRLRWRIFALIVMSLLGCNRPVGMGLIQSSVRRDISDPKDVWIAVDASAAAGGDGSREHPLRILKDALSSARGRSILIAPGLYEGPFFCGEATKLKGPRSAVLFSGGEGAVISASGGCLLEGLSVQGGAVGVEARGEDPGRGVSVQGVAFAGQRRAAITVTSGALTLEDAELSASLSESRGVLLQAGSLGAQIFRTHFRGPYRVAVEVEPGGGPKRLELSAVQVFDAVSAVRARGPLSVEVQGLAVDAGRGVALELFSAHGRMRHLRVSGHEVSLRIGGGSVLELEDAVFVRPERAGLEVVKSVVHARDLVVLEAGDYGAVQVVGAALFLERAFLHRTHGDALVVVDGELSLSDSVMSDSQNPDGASGAGFQLRRSVARVQSVDVVRPGYVGAVVAEASRVSLSDVVVRGGTLAALSVETQAFARGVSLTLLPKDGSAAAISTQGSLALDAAFFGTPALFADCPSGARLFLGRVRGLDPFASLGACTGRLIHPLGLEPPPLPRLGLP